MRRRELTTILDAALLGDDEVTYRILAGVYIDMARRYAALGQRDSAARLTKEAERQHALAMEARAEARFRAPSRYGPGKTEREQARSLAAFKGHETRQEAEHMAEVNVAPEHLALWRKVKASIRGNPHQRWERFVHYCEERPAEVTAALAEQYEDVSPPSSRAA